LSSCCAWPTLAATSGGNCPLSEPGRTVEHAGVKIIGPANLPAEIPVHASQMFSKNVVTFLNEMVDGEAEPPVIAIDFENDVLGPTCLTHNGEVRER